MKISILFLLLVLFSSCKGSSEKNFFNGDLKEISFDKELFLDSKRMDVDSIGIVKAEDFHSYLLLTKYRSTSFLSLYSYPNLEFIGEYFHKGEGLKDFLSFNIIKKEYPYLWIQDYRTKQLKKVNVEKGFDRGNIEIEKVYNYQNIEDPFNLFYINDTCLIIKNFNQKKGLHYLRFNPQIGKIMSEEISLYNKPVDYNLMNKISTLADNIHPDGTKIVTVTGAFDQIDILDLTDLSKSFSVSTSSKRTSYEQILTEKDEDLKTYYFSIPVCDKEKIFVLYESIDDTQIHVIDWEGNPIIRLHLQRNIRDFSIDFERKLLYGTEDVSENIYVYDIHDIV